MTSENKVKCKKCGVDNPDSALFCMKCANPLNEDARMITLGWKPVIRDFMLPGWGRYTWGMKRSGIIIMLLFTMFMSLYILDSVNMAIKTVNMTMGSGRMPSAASIQKNLEANKNFKSEFLSWGYLVIWIGTVVDSIRIKQRKTGKNP